MSVGTTLLMLRDSIVSMTSILSSKIKCLMSHKVLYKSTCQRDDRVSSWCNDVQRHRLSDQTSYGFSVFNDNQLNQPLPVQPGGKYSLDSVHLVANSVHYSRRPSEPKRSFFRLIVVSFPAINASAKSSQRYANP